MAKLQQFLQGHPKPEFSEKVQRRDRGKLFNNRPKSNHRMKGLKALWRKWHYPLIRLVCTYSAKDGKDFGAKSGSKRARIAKL